MRKGISLVALIITIIVLVILTGTIVLTAFNNGILEKSEEAVFKSDIQSFQEELTMYIMNKKAEFAYSEVNVIYNDDDNEHYNNMKEYIKSFSKKYASKVQIVKDKIEYIGSNEQEKQWVSGLGVTVNSVEVIGNISDWEISGETDLVRIIGYKGTKTENVEIPNVLMIDGKKQKVDHISLHNDTNKFSGTLTIPSNVSFNSISTSNTENVYKIIIKDNVKITANALKGNFDEIIIGNNCTIKNNNLIITINSNITIGNNCTIEKETFTDCKIVGNVKIGDNSKIGEAAFYAHSDDEGITGELTIGNNTYVGGATFWGNCNISSIKLGENVSLCESCFAYCEGIVDLKIPGSTNIMGSYCFDQCTNLKNVKLGNGISIITDFMFYGCSKLTSINIPSTVTEIGLDAFDECPNLTITVGSLAVENLVKESGFTGTIVKGY